MNRLLLTLQFFILCAVVALLIRIWPMATNQSWSSPLGHNGSPQVSNAILPIDLESSLAGIESVLGKQSGWPDSLEKVGELQKQLANIVNGLDPGKQEQVLPRLIPRRWEIQALWLLSKDMEPPIAETNKLRSLADEMDLLLAAAPIDSSDQIKTHLAERERELRKKIAEVEKRKIIDTANVALKADVIDKMEASIRELSTIDDDDARKLKFFISLQRDVTMITADLEKIEKISDRELREYGYIRLRQQILDLRLQVKLGESRYGTNEKLTTKLGNADQRVSNGIENGLKARQDESSRKQTEYQKWALAQIRKVKTYEEHENEELVTIPALDRINPGSSLKKAALNRAQEALASSMNIHMAVINQALLDEAVATWYRKVFIDRFDKLDEARKQKVINTFASKEKCSFDKCQNKK